MARPSNKPVVGISLMEGRIDAAVYDPKQGVVTQGATLSFPAGDLENAQALQGHIQAVLQQSGAKGVKSVCVSVPSRLMRQIEMPKLEDKDLYTALASEAERYQSFMGTEAIADFARVPALPNQAPGTERIVYGALRKDRLQNWLAAFQGAKLSIERLDIHINQMLRAMAGSGVLDAVVQQTGDKNTWGTVFRGHQNVWFVLWQGTEVIELREVNMDLGVMASEDELTRVILENDIQDELRRTAQNHPPVAVWLVDGLNPQILPPISQKLGVAVQPCGIGPIVSPQVSVPLHPSAIGAALSNHIEFPFGMNFARLTTASKVAATPKAAGGKGGGAASGLASKLGPILFGLGMFATVVSILAGVVLWAYLSFFLQPKANELTTELQQKQTQQAQLAAQRDQLQRQYDTRAALADLIHRVTLKNRLYPALLGDLHSITPTSVWVYELALSDQMTVKGKGLNENAVIKFAKQFDPLIYVTQVQVSNIAEEVVNETQIIYDFELNGQTLPDALTPPPPPPEEPAAEAKNEKNTQGKPTGASGP